MPPSLPDVSALPRRFRLGDWTVDVRAGEIQRGSDKIRLEPKVMGVLGHLAAQSGEVVSREELLDAVWPDVIVTENALSRCVSDLRRALHDDPRAPTLIETIPKTGYRLLLPIEPVDAPSPAWLAGDGVPAWSEIAAPSPPSRAAVPRRGLSRRGQIGLALVTVLGLSLALLVLRPTAPHVLEVHTLRPVTAFAGSEGLAAVSPEGDRVAYVRFAEGEQTGSIEIVGVEGGTPLRLTEGSGDTYPVFSPDGQRLAFLRCEKERCRIRRISTLGTDELPLAEVIAHPSGLAWSPDGRTLAYVERASATAPLHLALFDLETGQRRNLTTPSATAFGDLFPVFSPDGSRIAFVRRTDALTGDIYIVSLNGGEPVAVSTDKSQVARLSWLPDGRTLLAASDRDGTFRLWQFSTAGVTPTPLPLEAAMPIGPALNARGDRLVVEAWDLPIQLWRYDFTDGEPARSALAPSTRWDRMPALSPDASRAAFVSTRSGHAELWTAGLDEGAPQRLTHLAGPSVRTPQWSPDGQRIAFVVQTDGQSDVYTIPAEGGTPRRLTATETDELHPRWSSDGRSLFVGRRWDDRWEGVRLSVEGEAETMLVPEAVVLAPSPDGRALWYARADTPGLWSLPLGPDGGPQPGASPTRLVPDLAPDDATSWAVIEDGMIYLRRTDDSADLVRWTSARSELLLRGPLGLDLWAPPLAASRDGSTILVAQMGLPEIDLLTAELVRRP